MASRTQQRQQIFRGVRIAIGDHFRADMHVDDIELAITRRGGKVTREVDKDTTILVTSDKDYMRKSANVKAALCKGGSVVPIVEWKWFMDCIDRNRKRPVKLYRLQQDKKKRKDDEEAAQAEAAIYAESMEREGLFINWELNNIYTDATGFKFKVRLTRPRAEDGEMDEDERSIVSAASGRTDDRPRDKEHEILTLYLAESKEKNPALYTFAFEYQKRKGGKKFKNRPTFAGGVFADEFERFKDYFERKCGISWDERLAKVGVMRHLGFFEYEPPANPGAPLGLIENDQNIPEAYHDAVMSQRRAAAARDMAELFGEEHSV